MDFIIRFFVWITNCIISGKAQAVGIAVFGAIISYALFKITPTVFSAAYFIYPNFEHYILEHLLVAKLILFLVFMTPLSIGGFIAIQQLKYIYYKENYRHF